MNANDNDNSELNLIDAIREGSIEGVRALINKGENVNAVDNNDRSALIWAAKNGQEDIVEALLGKDGIDVNLADKYGDTALILAAHRHIYNEGKIHMKMVRALLDRDDINVNLADNKGNTALMLAASGGHKDIALALLGKADIDVNLVNEYGYTALIWGALYGHINIVEALLDKGADVNFADNNGYTALIWAAERGHIECVRALEEAQQKLFDLKNVLSEANTNSLSPSDTIGKINGLGLSKGYIDNLLKQAKKQGYPNDDLEEQINKIDKTSPDLMKHIYQEVAKFHGKMAAQIAHSDKVFLNRLPPDANVIIFNNLPFSSLMNVATASGLSVKSLAGKSASP